jgi:hypothetical protein
MNTSRQEHWTETRNTNIAHLGLHNPQLADTLCEYQQRHDIHFHPKNDTLYTCTLRDKQTGVQHSFVVSTGDAPPFILARYQTYNPQKQWLLILGIEALSLPTLHTQTLSELSPIVVIEPDMGRLLARLSLSSLHTFFQNASVFLYTGEQAFAAFLQAFQQELYPYMLSCSSVCLVPHPDLAQQQILNHFLSDFQQKFAQSQARLQQEAAAFRLKYQQFDPKNGRKILALIPAVGCWLALGRAFSDGFRQSGYDVQEYNLPYPPSRCTGYDRLSFAMTMYRFQPDFLFTLSHSSDLFAQGFESIPIPRMIWVVDYPDHLIQHSPNPHDVFYPVWDHLGEVLKQRPDCTHAVRGEIQCAGFPWVSKRNAALSCEVGFVGSVNGNQTVRAGISTDVLTQIDRLTDEKIHNPHLLFSQLWERFQLGESERSHILKTVETGYRQQGMSDEQVLTLFLHTECTRKRRVSLISRLVDFEVQIYGNPDWAPWLEGTGMEKAFQGKGLLSQECLDFYASAAISLNIHPLFPHSGPTPRDFDIPMCDGFVLTDLQRYSGARTELFFIPGEEMALYDTEEDLVRQIRHYLQNAEERAAITNAAKERIARDHLFTHRAKQMMDDLRQIG